MDNTDKRRRSGPAIAARLIGLVKPMLPIMLCAILMGVAGSLCAIFITVFGAFALLHVLGMAAPLSNSILFGAVVVFALLRGVLHYAEQASNHYIAFKLLALIRDKVFRALRWLAPARLETRDKGNLISMITTDIELLEVFYAHTISPVAIAILVSGFMTVFLAQYHLGLALIALCGYGVVGVLVPLLISRLGSESGAAYRAESGRLGSTVLDSMRGLREVLQFRQGPARLSAMEEQTHQLESKQERMKRYEGLATTLSNTAILVFSLTVLFCGLWLYQNSLLGFEAVLVCFVGTISSFGPVVALANLSNNLLQTFAAADRVLDILEETPITGEITDGEDVVFDGMEAENISFAYGDEAVLRDYSIDLPADAIIGISGKSGSGKSTLLRLLMRFWDVDSGRVSISNRDVRGVNTQSLRHAQSFVTQETVLFNDSIENNVKVANMNATRAQVEEACRKASVHDFITSLPKGYDTSVGELGDLLSGGERQRIGLARAFLHDAPMILLDEPTSNLDSLNEGVVLRSLQKESAGKTVVLVSHRASTLGITTQKAVISPGRKR